MHQVQVLFVDNPLRPRLFKIMVSLVIKVVTSTGNYSQINLIHFVVGQSNNIKKLSYSNSTVPIMNSTKLFCNGIVLLVKFLN